MTTERDFGTIRCTVDVGNEVVVVRGIEGRWCIKRPRYWARLWGPEEVDAALVNARERAARIREPWCSELVAALTWALQLFGEAREAALVARAVRDLGGAR